MPTNQDDGRTAYLLPGDALYYYHKKPVHNRDYVDIPQDLSEKTFTRWPSAPKVRNTPTFQSTIFRGEISDRPLTCDIWVEISCEYKS